MQVNSYKDGAVKVRSLALAILSSFCRVASGLVLAKLMAIYGGPKYIYYLGQTQSLLNILTTLSQFGIGYGFIALTPNEPSSLGADYAEYKNISSIFSIYSFGLVCALAILLFLPTSLLSSFLGIHINTLEYKFISSILLIPLVFFPLFQNVLIIKGLVGRSHLLISIQCLLAILFVFLIPRLLLRSPLIYMPFAPALGASCILVFFVVFYRGILFANLYVLRFDPNLLKCIWRYRPYIILTLSSVFSTQFMNLYSRQYVISSSTIELAGIWQSLLSLSSVISLVVVSYLSTYFIRALGRSHSRNMRFARDVKIYISISFVLLALITYFFGSQFISVAYSSEFIIPNHVLLLMVISEFFRALSGVYAFVFMRYSLIAYLVIAELVALCSFVFFSHCFRFLMLSPISSACFSMLLSSFGVLVFYHAACSCSLARLER